MSTTTYSFDAEQFAARARLWGRSAWSFAKIATKFCVLMLLLAAALVVVAYAWSHALWPDAAVWWDAVHDATNSGHPPWPLSKQRNFYLCLLGGGLLGAFMCQSALKKWWAMHVTGKAPALLLARIGRLEEENAHLTDFVRAVEVHENEAFKRFETVLRFPGMRAVMLAALHPDRAKNDNDRKALTE